MERAEPLHPLVDSAGLKFQGAPKAAAPFEKPRLAAAKVESKRLQNMIDDELAEAFAAVQAIVERDGEDRRFLRAERDRGVISERSPNGLLSDQCMGSAMTNACLSCWGALRAAN